MDKTAPLTFLTVRYFNTAMLSLKNNAFLRVLTDHNCQKVTRKYEGKKQRLGKLRVCFPLQNANAINVPATWKLQEALC